MQEVIESGDDSIFANCGYYNLKYIMYPIVWQTGLDVSLLEYVCIISGKSYCLF